MVLERAAIERVMVRDHYDLCELLGNDAGGQQVHQRLGTLGIEGAQRLIQEDESGCGAQFLWQGCQRKGEPQREGTLVARPTSVTVGVTELPACCRSLPDAVLVSQKDMCSASGRR